MALKMMMYRGCPGPMSSARSCSQLMPSPWPNHWPSDAGNSKMLLAKMAGITPAMLIFKGRWLAWP